MKSENGSQILVHLTALGVRYLRLKGEQVPTAIAELKEGRSPHGEELKVIPPYAVAVLKHLRDNKKNWILVPDRAGWRNEEEFSTRDFSPSSEE